MRIDPAKTHKEPTYQVVLDALALTTCYPAFLIAIDVSEIYMHQFWFTINKKDSTSYRFKIVKKRLTFNMEVFREILQICPRHQNQDFASDEEIVSFIKELGHKGDVKSITEVVVDHMYQPWRTFAAIINKCLSGKITESDNHDEEKETQDDEYVHTPEDYVHTNDEKNDEYKEFDEEEYEELYGNVNISLKDDEPADKDKVDEEMNVTGQVNVNQEGANNQVKDDAQATKKTKVPIPSSSISSDYAAKYLNLDNIPPVDTEVVSMLEINFQHEAPRTLPLLTISVSIIPEHTVANPPKIVTTALSTTISSLLVTNLEKDVKVLKTVDFSAVLLSTIKSKFLNAIKEYLGTSLDDALHKVLQNHSADITKEHYVLAENVERLRQQYVLKKSTEDIRNIKIEHER
ncbi:hypothetical protein Tco_1281699 [Tanacetum coccineum]